jgi:thiol-disulfide isomerase/thioredoxin
MSARRIILCESLILAWCLGTANAQVVISGLVTGHDGKSMPIAQAQLLNGGSELIDSATAGPDGGFELRAPHAGLLRVQVDGPLHGMKEALVFTDQPQTISLRVQLTAPEYLVDSTNLRLSTSDPRSPLNNTPFVRQPDGTFVAEIESQAPELLLAVNGLVKGRPPLELPGAAEYRCLNSLHCYAVAHPMKGKLRVVLEPARLVHTAELAWVRYAKPDSPVAIAGEVLDRTEAFLLAMRETRRELALKTGKAVNEIAKDPPPAGKVNKVVHEIEQERVPLVRQARFIEYLALVVAGAPADRALVRRVLDELTPASPLWTFPYANIAGQAIVATGEPAKYIDYATKIMDAQPSKPLKAFVGLGIVGVLRAGGFEALEGPVVAKLRAQAGDLPVVKSVLGDRIRPGMAAPAFRAPSLDNPAVEYTGTSLKGRIYLIDFWATWCAPCVAELPGLTRLYEKYHGQGFEILSYSIDSNRDVIRQFRKERTMPWLHAIDPQFRELQSPMAKDFDVLAIPRAVLADANGIVIATDQECRGSKLEELLKRLLPVPATAH